MSNELAEKSISFIRKNRSYVICYNYGQDLVEIILNPTEALLPRRTSDGNCSDGC